MGRISGRNLTSAIHTQGITVYRAIKYSNTNIGDWIVLPGAGGGLSHLAVQYAAAMGLRVLAIGMPLPPFTILISHSHPPNFA